MQVFYSDLIGYSNPWTCWQSDPSRSILSVFKKPHSSRESFSPGHGGARSLQLGGNAHAGPPTEAPSGRERRRKKKNLSFQARLFFKASPAAWALCIPPNPRLRARERGGKGEWEPGSAERGGGGGEDRKGGEQRKGGQAGGRAGVGVVKKKSKGAI